CQSAASDTTKSVDPDGDSHWSYLILAIPLRVLWQNEPKAGRINVNSTNMLAIKGAHCVWWR
ncbi:MAG: hypothetical protein MUQ84_12250, partial [Loktanella sp.]|nr:hypothetical protein [Loktanella sp.]